MGLSISIKMRVAAAFFIALLFVGAALADTDKHDDPIKCYQTDPQHMDQLGNEVDCSTKTCLKIKNDGGVLRSCPPSHTDDEKCETTSGTTTCSCNSNLCNSSTTFKVNHAAIFGI